MKMQVAATIVLLSLVIVLAAVQIWFQLATPYINHDVALLLAEGDRVAHGKLPYVDVIDVNPPTVMYISAVPAWIASVLGIPLYATGRYFWWVIVTASIGLIVWLFRRAFPEKTNSDLLFVAAILLYANLHVYAAGEYAQRDHLIILWILALSLVRVARYGGIKIPAPAAILTGVVAGLALAMKPQYILLPLLLELLLAAWHKRINLHFGDRELLVGVFVGAVFLLHPFVLPPMAANSWYWIEKTAQSYRAYNAESIVSIFSKSIESPVDLFWFVLVVLLLWTAFLTRKGTAFRASALFGLLGTAGFAVMLLQFKGFPYHVVPFRLCAMTGLGFLISDLAAFLAARYRQSALAFAGLALFPIGLTSPEVRWMIENSVSGDAYKYARNDFAELLRDITGPDESVMFISTSVLPSFPAIAYADRGSIGRIQTAFPIALIYHSANGYQVPEGSEEYESRFLRYELEDIRAEKPAAIFISAEKRPQALPRGFVIEEYLKRRGFCDSLGSDYRLVGSHRGFKIYLRTVRAPAPGIPPVSIDPDTLESVRHLRQRGILAAPDDTTGS